MTAMDVVMSYDALPACTEYVKTFISAVRRILEIHQPRIRNKGVV